MLSKKYRLPIQTVINSKALIKKGAYFTVKTFTSPHPYARIGVTISKSVSPKATVRNKLKRIIFTGLTPVVKTRPNTDILVIVKPQVSELAAKDAIIRELFKTL